MNRIMTESETRETIDIIAASVHAQLAPKDGSVAVGRTAQGINAWRMVDDRRVQLRTDAAGRSTVLVFKHRDKPAHDFTNNVTSRWELVESHNGFASWNEAVKFYAIKAAALGPVAVTA